MENINEEKIKKFKKITELILNGLKERGINPILSEDDTSPNEEWGNSMTMSFSFSNGGLKYWYLGIWGCGRWSETYNCDNSEDYISVFLIHKWTYDKFRPSSSDIEYRITLNDKPVEIYHVIQGLEEIHKNPIQEYYKTFWEHKSDHDMPCPEYFTTYKILDNDKIERISYEIYGTTDYWDLLLLINDREALCGITYDFETCTSNVESYINKYEFEIYSNNDISDERKTELLDEFYEKYKLRNEMNRYMYIIKPSKIQDFLKILKMAGFEW
jgi:hypothetical protein